MDPETPNKEKVFKLVVQVPEGRITSFGRIGDRTGINPIIVGFILSGMSSEDMKEIPWHRVVNRDGYVSAIKLGDKGRLQEDMLRSEGIEIQDFQIINPEKYWWEFD